MGAAIAVIGSLISLVARQVPPDRPAFRGGLVCEYGSTVGLNACGFFGTARRGGEHLSEDTRDSPVAAIGGIMARQTQAR